MSITVNVHGSIADIVLSGGMDYSTQENIHEASRRALAAENIREIRVDLAEVTFIDSSCIRALVMLQRQADEKGIALVLLHCNYPIREIFEIGGFDTMFTIR